MTDPIVELRDVFCVHRTDEGDAAALQGMNIEVGAEEVVCVLGPSGSGKTTLLRVIAGLEAPSAGVVNVLGSDVGRLGSRARAWLRHRHVGFLGQQADAALSPSLPARQAVALPLLLRGARGRAVADRVDELLDGAGLRDRGGALPRELSGGERQRLALCVALAHRPSLLLADEPTGELDERAAEGVRGLIAELARVEGASAIVVSHDPATAGIADRMIRIRDGRVVEDRRRDSDGALVVGAGGWLRLPSELMGAAGIRRRAHARVVSGGVLLTAAASPAAARASTSPPTSSASPRPWAPARVELRSLTRGYRQGRSERHVISGLGHVFAPGKMTAVTGRSGTGKTTLLRLIAGLDRPDAGRVTIDGWSLGEGGAERLATLRRERIGYLPQEPAPVGFLSAIENVALALRVRGCEAPAAAERAAFALGRVGLTGRAAQRVQRLSAGEAQRVALARALAGARGLLIVDEPTSRLDETTAVEVADLLAAAAGDGQTVICATHEPAVIRRADDVLSLGVSKAA